MKNNPLVSIIVPTRNSAKFLEACLKSIKNQTYRNTELIVVDNNSADSTKKIAKKYTDKVFNQGPERSAQRNFGVNRSSGDYVLIIDSDMILSPKVISGCVKKIQKGDNAIGVIIPEESFGKGFWANCKKLEKSFYIGVDFMEAARFFDKSAFQKVGGFDEKMVSGEDWDLSQRIEKEGKIKRINDFIYHNEGKINLLKTIKKKFYYAGEFKNYAGKNKNGKQFKKQTGILGRYKLFLSRPRKLFKNPLLGLGMLFMKTCEFAFGGAGYLLGKSKKIKKNNSDKNIREYSQEYFLQMEGGFDDFAQGRIAERFERLLKLINFSRTDKVLDLGAGRGEIGTLLKGKVKEIILSDYSEEALQIMRQGFGNRKNIKIEKINAKQIPYPNGYFDKVFLLEVIEHLYTHEANLVLAEIKRVLKKDGLLILSTSPNKYLSSPQYYLAEKLFKLKLKGKKYHLREHSYFSLRRVAKNNFHHFKIYCLEEKMFFFNVVDSLNLPKIFKRGVFLSNRFYDLKTFSYLRTKTFLKKFLAQSFVLIAKK